MTIKEIKLLNLKRLVNERRLSNDEFAAVLGKTKQQASRLLHGHAGIGDKTIKTLCRKWKIKEIEFIKIPNLGTSSCFVNCSDPLKVLCRQVKNIIESKTPYSSALKLNIEAFDFAVEDGRSLKSDMEELRKKVEYLEKTRDPDVDTGKDGGG